MPKITRNRMGAGDSAGEPVNTAWYHRPIGEGPVWGEPYLGSATGIYWGGYGTTFYKPVADGEVAITSKIASNYLEGSDKLMELPTGIIIESVDFVPVHNVAFTAIYLPNI